MTDEITHATGRATQQRVGTQGAPVWRVKMSPAIEENFSQFSPEERLKHAAYLRDIARQLEVSARVAISDRKPCRRPAMRPLPKRRLALN